MTGHREHAQRDAQPITTGRILDVDDETFRHVGIEVAQLDELVDDRADRKQSSWRYLGIGIPPGPDMRGTGDFYRLQAELSNEVEDATAQVEGRASQRPHGSAQRVCGCSIWQVEQETPPVGLDDRETPSRSKHAEHFRQCLIGVRYPLQRPLAPACINRSVGQGK